MHTARQSCSQGLALGLKSFGIVFAFCITFNQFTPFISNVLSKYALYCNYGFNFQEIAPLHFLEYITHIGLYVQIYLKNSSAL